jgi:hypothetical protein
VATTASEQRETADQFLARMESQCFQIDRYRWRVRSTEGRILSEDEAAREWIEQYAADFARERLSPSDG